MRVTAMIIEITRRLPVPFVIPVARGWAAWDAAGEALAALDGQEAS